jgi:hypothetical protein
MSIRLFTKYGINSRRTSVFSIAAQGIGLEVDSISSTLSNADYVVYDWRRNGKSIAALHLPFVLSGDSSATTYKDFSTFARTAVKTGTVTFASNSIETGAGQITTAGGANGLNYGHVPQLDSCLKYTILHWVKRGATSVNFENYYSQRDSNTNRLQGLTDDVGVADYLACTGNGLNTQITTLGAPMTQDVWKMVANVYDGTLAAGFRHKIYVNTTEVPNVITNGPIPSFAPFTLGDFTVHMRSDNTVGLIGTSDYFIVLPDVAATSTQITAWYNSGTPDFKKIESSVVFAGDWTCVATPVTANVAGTPVTSNTYAAGNNFLALSGSDLVATTIDVADYTVYDFQRSTDSGVTWNSTLLANFHYKASGLTTANTFKNFTTYGVTGGTPSVDITYGSTGGQDGLGDIRAATAGTVLQLDVGTAFDSASWTVASSVSINTGLTSFTTGLTPFGITEGGTGERNIIFENSGGTGIFEGTAVSPTISKQAPAVIPDNSFHRYSVVFNGSTITGASDIAIRFDGVTQTGGATSDGGTAGALTGTKSIFSRLTNSGATVRFRFDKQIAAPWGASVDQQDEWLSPHTASQTLYSPITTSGSGQYRVVTYPINGGVIGSPRTSNIITI